VQTGDSVREPAYRAGDLLTIASVAIVAHIVGTVLHEGAGHGGACLAVGGRPLLISTVNMECSAGGRLVIAGGTLMNLSAAAVFFGLGRAARATATVWRYFCWLSMTVNLLVAAGYFAFSGVGGFGDWAEFVRGFHPQWAWRTGLAVFGCALYLAFVRVSLMELRPLIGSDRKQRYRRAVELSRVPYFAGGMVACVAGALNPQGWILVALSAAAASFGGGSGLLWMPELLRGGAIPPGAGDEPAALPRSWGWIAAAVVGACVFIAVLGPGVRFGAGVQAR